jgi:hypothetical protein
MLLFGITGIEQSYPFQKSPKTNSDIGRIKLARAEVYIYETVRNKM